MATFKTVWFAAALAGLAFLAPAGLRAASADSIVGGATAVADLPAAGAPFRQDGRPGDRVIASGRLFEPGRGDGLSPAAAGRSADAWLRPYVRSAPARRGLHRQLEAGLALPLADDLSLATAYGKVRLRGAMPSTYALKTQFAKVGLKFDF